jgi:hypothetical protein
MLRGHSNNFTKARSVWVLLILGVLALSAAPLLVFPGEDVEVYGTFSARDLSQIKSLALRQARGLALGNLRRSLHKPKEISDALWQVLSCRVGIIERCWNSEVCAHVGSHSFGTFWVLVTSNGNWCVQGPTSFPPPREPVPDADPSRRHPVSISVPTGLRIERKGNTFDYVFTGFETAYLTVGFKMLTGVEEQVDLRRDGTNGGTSISRDYGGPLPTQVPCFNPGYTPNTVPSECRLTIFETDQPPGYHVEPTMGKHYKVLLTRTFKEPFQ